MIISPKLERGSTKDKPRGQFCHVSLISEHLKTKRERDSGHRTWEEANSWVLYSFSLLVYNSLDFIFKCMSWPRKAKEHRLPAVSNSPFLIFWSYRKQSQNKGCLGALWLSLSKQYTIRGFKITELHTKAFIVQTLANLMSFNGKLLTSPPPRQKTPWSFKVLWLSSKGNNWNQQEIHRISVLNIFFLFLVLSTKLSKHKIKVPLDQTWAIQQIFIEYLLCARLWYE